MGGWIPLSTGLVLLAHAFYKLGLVATTKAQPAFRLPPVSTYFGAKALFRTESHSRSSTHSPVRRRWSAAMMAVNPPIPLLLVLAIPHQPVHLSSFNSEAAT